MRVTEGETLKRVFVGRGDELERLKLDIGELQAHTLLLYGQALVGKTCLLLQVSGARVSTCESDE